MHPTRAGRVAAVGALATLLLASCGSDDPTPDSPSPTSRPSQPASSLTVPAPLIVQVENSPESRPQSGLSAADTVYEYVAEGGISRFSAVFVKPPSVRVGPVRSARLATIQLLELHRGVLVYSGASTVVQFGLRASGQKFYNENAAAGDLFRISGRYPPHNLYTDGPHLADLQRRAAAPPITYPPAPPPPSPAAPGLARPAISIQVPISRAEHPGFSWNSVTHRYARSEGLSPFIDQNTGAAVEVATLVVQQVDVTPAPEIHDVLGDIGVRHNLLGTGVAQVFSGGAEYDATWTQGPVGPAQLTYPHGGPRNPAAGPVWICLVPRGSAATFL